MNQQINIATNCIAPHAENGEVVICCRDVTKTYKDFLALKGISLEVRKGEIICIVGPSGGGKSTFLRTLNGLEAIDGGSIDVHGVKLPGTPEDIRRVRSEVGMLFQNFNLFPHMTVRQNLMLAPMRVLGISREEAAARATTLLARVGIENQIDKYPAQLSGGQQQRVAIARALAMNPLIMLFDEPTSALDPEMVKEVLDVMRELAETGMTMLIVTHEMKFAQNVASRILFMVDGSVALDCTSREFFHEHDDPRLKRFLNQMA
jgi:ABC-type polar amino acid transport system ATPase subunit